MSGAYVSTERVASKTHEGVTLVMKRMSVARRTELERLQASARLRMRGLQRQLAPLSREFSEAAATAKKAGGALVFPDDKSTRLIELSDEIERIDREEMAPVAVSYFVEGIEGLTIDGEAATTDKLIALGPYDLYLEALERVTADMSLSPAEAQNLGSLSTSSAAEPESATRGTAIAVEQPDTTSSGAAPSSTVQASANATVTL